MLREKCSPIRPHCARIWLRPWHATLPQLPHRLERLWELGEQPHAASRVQFISPDHAEPKWCTNFGAWFQALQCDSCEGGQYKPGGWVLAFASDPAQHDLHPSGMCSNQFKSKRAASWCVSTSTTMFRCTLLFFHICSRPRTDSLCWQGFIRVPGYVDGSAWRVPISTTTLRRAGGTQSQSQVVLIVCAPGSGLIEYIQRETQHGCGPRGRLGCKTAKYTPGSSPAIRLVIVIDALSRWWYPWQTHSTHIEPCAYSFTEYLLYELIH